MDSILQFFDLHRFVPADLFLIGTLIILEGLLSCDNAVALAVLVRGLPEAQQGKALRYGIIGAYVFLFIALLLASWIVSLWYLKILGGLYLMYLVVQHFRPKPAELDEQGGSGQVKRWIIPGLGIFWSTVVMVELTDIAFSVDSIAAAVAFSDKFFVLLCAGMIYILIMRFAAQGFIILLKRFPHLETAAFVAVGIIGMKLLLELPGDRLGLVEPPPQTAPATTAQAYIEQAEQRRAAQALVHIPHVVSIYPYSLAEPDYRALPETGRDRRDVSAHWNLHGRALVHLASEATAGLVVCAFALGFLGRARREEDGEAKP